MNRASRVWENRQILILGDSMLRLGVTATHICNKTTYYKKLLELYRGIEDLRNFPSVANSVSSIVWNCMKCLELKWVR